MCLFMFFPIEMASFYGIPGDFQEMGWSNAMSWGYVHNTHFTMVKPSDYGWLTIALPSMRKIKKKNIHNLRMLMPKSHS